MATSFRGVSESADWPDRLAAGWPGTYALLIRLSRSVRLTVGALGARDFPPGWYVYIGSALGPGGLRARVARHLRAEKRSHWHIDRLLAAGRVVQVGLRFGLGRDECRVAQRVGRNRAARIVVPHFGASDCDCTTHLFHFNGPPGALLANGFDASLSPAAFHAASHPRGL